MAPRTKKQSIEEYAEQCAKELGMQVIAAIRKDGPEAGWDKLFDAICKEGVNVQDLSPAGVVVYQFYISIAAIFLRQNPNGEKLLKLMDRVVADLKLYAVRVRTIDDKNFEIKERQSMLVSVNIIGDTVLKMASEYSKKK